MNKCECGHSAYHHKDHRREWTCCQHPGCHCLAFYAVEDDRP